jgi:hypothetical protein
VVSEDDDTPSEDSEDSVEELDSRSEMEIDGSNTEGASLSGSDEESVLSDLGEHSSEDEESNVGEDGETCTLSFYCYHFGIQLTWSLSRRPPSE